MAPDDPTRCARPRSHGRDKSRPYGVRCLAITSCPMRALTLDPKTLAPGIFHEILLQFLDFPPARFSSIFP